jgi:leucyl-tRNA synthetase
LPLAAVRTLILLVAPFAPHVAEELWQTGAHDVDGKGTLAHEAWPTWDETICQDDTAEVALQINGRVRGRIALARTASEDEARAAALSAAAIASHIAGRSIKKFVYVPGRIVSVVVD